MKYTEKIHAQRLLKMLEKEDLCGLCPKSDGFIPGNISIAFGNRGIYPDSPTSGACLVCQSFVGVLGDCPCFKLDREEAIKRTWLALEEKGYI